MMRIIKVVSAIGLLSAGAHAQSALDQLKNYGKGGPPVANPISDKSGTPAATSNLAASAGKYDIVGIKLGMTVRDALAALKAHSPNFKLQPDSIKYDFLPYALTFGINALPLNLDPRDTRLMPPNSEQFSMLLTMPPNQEVVSKLTRFMTFGKDTAPLADTLAEDLIAKYGPVTYDAGSALFSQGAVREMYWVDDQSGRRLRWTRAQLICYGAQGFLVGKRESADHSGYIVGDLGMDPVVARYRIESGYSYVASEPECATFTMVRARVLNARALGLSAPNLAGALAVMITSAPLDKSASDATQDYVQKAAKARDNKQSDAAKQNRPKL